MLQLVPILFVQERESEGPFTFQVILWANGDIEFAYESIPLAITTIQDEEHPVKVGLSDAYIIDRTIFCKCCTQEALLCSTLLHLLKRHWCIGKSFTINRYYNLLVANQQFFY